MVPDSMPLKDLLRGLRSGMTAGRMAFEPVYRNLPPPARDVIRGLDHATARLDSATVRLANTLFDTPDGPRPGTGWALDRIAVHPKGAAIFAGMAYGTLAAALRRFSDRPALISETLACQAFMQARRLTDMQPDALPAELVLQLLGHSVIRPLPFDPRPAPRAAIEQAVIAFVLMLCTAHDSAAEDTDLLDLCCDVAPQVLRHGAPTRPDRPALTSALAACARLI